MSPFQIRQRIPSVFLIPLLRDQPLQWFKINDRIDQLIHLLGKKQLKLTYYLIHLSVSFLTAQKLHYMLLKSLIMTIQIIHSGQFSLMKQHDLVTQILCQLQNVSGQYYNMIFFHCQ